MTLFYWSVNVLIEIPAFGTVSTPKEWTSLLAYDPSPIQGIRPQQYVAAPLHNDLAKMPHCSSMNKSVKSYLPPNMEGKSIMGFHKRRTREFKTMGQYCVHLLSQIQF